MKLSDFIRSNIEAILAAWVRFAKTIPLGRELDTAGLHDHAKDILLVIAKDLDQPQTLDEQEEKSKGRSPRRAQDTAAKMHGAARVLEGFSVNDAMSEFRALRASVLRLWNAANTELPIAALVEMTRFNEAIDQALSESLERYSADKAYYTRLLDALLSSSPDLSYIWDLDGRFIYANDAMAHLYGVSPQEIIGKNFYDLAIPHAAELQQKLDLVRTAKTVFRGKIPHALPSGGEAQFDYLFVPALDKNGEVEAIAGTARDIAERKAVEEKIRHTANYDSLTDLPNRNLFRDRLEQNVKLAARTGLTVALFFIDLDGFKEVNDRLGHDAGDQLLRQTGQRISACVRDTDTVARIGGDEFTVILAEIKKTAHVEILAQQILDELAKPFVILEKEVQISGSIGITLYPQDAVTAEDMVRNADQAMYVAKKAGRNRFSFFTIAMRDAAWARLKVIDELRRALPLHQLVVYYQPIIDMATEKIVKAEALLRWNHPQNGLVLPGEFIALAEESGLIGDIGDWVLGESAKHARAWSAMLGLPFQIGVNKSPVEFMSKLSMKNWDKYLTLTVLDLACPCISVEITEGVLLNDSPGVRLKLDDLQKAGIELAIDDFGTGYSSLSYLQKFKVDYLKIDQSFVQDMKANVESRIFADTIIVMAHKLGLKVIAEGVETTAQRDWLKAAGCDYAQGFLFSRPVSPDDFQRLLMINFNCASDSATNGALK